MSILSKLRMMPVLSGLKVEITQSDFDKVLFDTKLTVVEKTFSHHLETNHVLFVISKDRQSIDYVLVKEISSEGTVIYQSGVEK